ncbi:conserved hypothetical protein [Cellulomonas flavigena DSM 20109]|uniref:Right handed beta helix domain-containing protein n=1 Tax=Cellulomonas flavigena (strain ATCC 482 / DSM 20109 / BCRC 11376 / JCM 18109 / NBRC 3775 / NCIMB 8073 / NRS 134) TaxID=446466 RepID=D5UK93_CELFN|nr:right-handed parallel beta-helix repeat-containing protein [Cellulomonas flavigena]ADG75754.1 conserved hypothetical protein [Cellulomonas flavigena DSM 20109]
MHSRSVVVAVLAGTVLVVAAPAQAAPSARPTPVTECGQTVTGPAYLARDLVCSGEGVRLAGGVLDLRGRTLQGTGRSDTGVALLAEGDVEVRNGRVTGFYQAVYAAGAGAKTIRGVTAEGNGTGVAAYGDMFDENQAEVRIIGSTVAGNTRGVSVAYLRHVEITGSTVRANGWGAELGWSGTGVVARSTFEDNELGLVCSVTCTVERSTFRSNTYEGIFQDDGDLTVRSSTFTENGTGYQGGMATARIERSTFTANDVGVRSSLELALELTGSTFTRNGTGYTDDPGVSGAPADLLTGNTFSRNGDGIVSDEPGLALGDNTATRNAGWGIHAPDAADLGGNRASGNGNDPQCVGVECGGPVS